MSSIMGSLENKFIIPYHAVQCIAVYSTLRLGYYTLHSTHIHVTYTCCIAGIFKGFYTLKIFYLMRNQPMVHTLLTILYAH